jgi:hypothetical protein
MISELDVILPVVPRATDVRVKADVPMVSMNLAANVELARRAADWRRAQFAEVSHVDSSGP